MRHALWAVALLGTYLQGEVVLNQGGVIAHIADGGGWQSAITLVNLDEVSVDYTLRFRNDTGSDLSLATDAGTGSSITGTLSPRGSRTITTSGNPQSAIVTGWAMVETAGTIGGSSLFRALKGAWAGAEATVPVDTHFGNRFSLQLDQTGSNVAGVAIVNPSGDSSLPVTLTFRDENGLVFLTDTFVMPPLAHTSIVVNQKYPASAGARGTIEISSTNLWMSVLALRFSGASIASILAQSSGQW